MCNKRINSLIKLTIKPNKPVQAVIPEPAVPRQPQMGAPVNISNRVTLKKAYTIPKVSDFMLNISNIFVHPLSRVTGQFVLYIEGRSYLGHF
nr:unnamed protein product [Callosobruchus chinensis]